MEFGKETMFGVSEPNNEERLKGENNEKNEKIKAGINEINHAFDRVNQKN